MDQTSMQIRVVPPLAVNKTKVSTYCSAPLGESAEAWAHRRRQCEDFCNASGVGTPDDLAAFEACQCGYQGALAQWQQGYERGVKQMVRGADEEARTLGIRPYSTTNDFRDETIYHGQYRYNNKARLEDRVWCIQSDLSSASSPQIRTGHLIAKVRLVDVVQDQPCVSSPWQVQSINRRNNEPFLILVSTVPTATSCPSPRGKSCC